MQNTDRHETEKFSRIARDWWNPLGPMRALHEINPCRLKYIDQHLDLNGKKVLDIGCGAGLLSEALAVRGAQVTAIDASYEILEVARQHALGNGLKIDYQQINVETLAADNLEKFDVITCMELLEHVPEPESIIAACSKLLVNGGHAFFSTINRTAKAYLFAIAGAEYLLRLLPTGTHDYSRFIRPSELAGWCEKHRLAVDDISGMRYLPLLHKAYLTSHPDINYLLHARFD